MLQLVMGMLQELLLLFVNVTIAGAVAAVCFVTVAGTVAEDEPESLPLGDVGVFLHNGFCSDHHLRCSV